MPFAKSVVIFILSLKENDKPSKTILNRAKLLKSFFKFKVLEFKI